MAVTVQLNGVTYDIPEPGDSGWGQDLSDYFVAQASGLLQKAGGTFTLTAEVDFGNTFGLKSTYFKTRTALPAAAGVLRLARTDSVSWRNAANSADLPLGVDVSGNLTFNGATFVSGGITALTGNVTASGPGSAVATIAAGAIVNSMVNASAAIAYSKLNLASSIVNADIANAAAIAYSKLSLTGSLVNADVSASAAIAFSKLATLTSGNILVGSAGNVATSVTMSGGATISNTGVVTVVKTAPTVQKFLSGSGTYTTPTSPAPLYIRVQMVGGGGGGSGIGTTTSAGAGGAGGNTTFGTTLLVANGGGGGAFTSAASNANLGGAGGSASLGTGPIGKAISGAFGGGGFYSASSSAFFSGGVGGASPFGGAGSGRCPGNAGAAGVTNSGSGGGGASTDGGSNVGGGAGGGAGGYVDAIIASPSATYAYAVGAAGTAGTAGTSGFAGGAGGSGVVIVEEYYQ